MNGAFWPERASQASGFAADHLLRAWAPLGWLAFWCLHGGPRAAPVYRAGAVGAGPDGCSKSAGVETWWRGAARGPPSESPDLLRKRRGPETEMQRLDLHRRLKIGLERRLLADRSVNGDK